MIARVYQAINTIAAELAHDGVAKTRLNSRDNYLYRSIDDVLGRLAPLLAAHRLCILPRALERTVTERRDDSGGLLISVALRAAFDLVSAEDGSCHTIEAYGEALDASDKATAKAMQSAYKYAVLQAFCIPAAQGEDADAISYRLKPGALPAEPCGGWQLWCDHILTAVQGTHTTKEVQQLQEANRASLAAISRERPELYQAVGQAIAARRAELGESASLRPGARDEPTRAPRTASDVVSPAATGTATGKRVKVRAVETKGEASSQHVLTAPTSDRTRAARANGSGAHA